MNLHENLYRPSLNYIKKERFTGSNDGIRFLFEKRKKDDDGDVLEACVWPEPFSFDHTAEEKKEYREFSLTEDGLKEAVAWVESKEPAFCNHPLIESTGKESADRTL